ncbi:MAG: DUF2804 domain-containing protein [Myxococcales bacterium]|nr:DUF2804 domain-containing protein [Myxococcales bacterium]
MIAKRDRLPTPSTPVAADGSAHYGVFERPFQTLNLASATFPFYGAAMPRGLVRSRLKEFQHVGIIGPDFYFGMAIVDVKYVGTFFTYFVDRQSGSFVERNARSFIGGRKLPENCWDHHGFFNADGIFAHLHNHLDQKSYRVSMEVPARGTTPKMAAELELGFDLESIEPLIAVLPVGAGRTNYTIKCPLRASGEIHVGDRVIRCDKEGCVALLDEHKALYPASMWWKWATFAGRDASGRVLAVNLTHNVNEDDERYNECAFWLDHKLHLLSAVRFEFDAVDHLRPWRIRTTDGRVDLEFRPQGERKELIDFIVARSQFHQPFGTFHGTVELDDESIDIDGLFGVCEDHRVRW